MFIHIFDPMRNISPGLRYHEQLIFLYLDFQKLVDFGFLPNLGGFYLANRTVWEPLTEPMLACGYRWIDKYLTVGGSPIPPRMLWPPVISTCALRSSLSDGKVPPTMRQYLVKQLQIRHYNFHILRKGSTIWLTLDTQICPVFLHLIKVSDIT